jgi:hypothetical protein
MPISHHLSRNIELALAARRGRRAVRLELDGQIVWAKRPRRGPGYTLYALQRVTAAVLQIPPLRPPRVSRGAAGLYAEARRLDVLRQRGWPLPRVLGVTDRWLALEDNGASLGTIVRKAPLDERIDLIRRTLTFLQSLHTQGGWHGAAQIRNFTQLGSRIGLIDFEDDLEPAMPLVMRQARDLLLFLMSAARFAEDDYRTVQTLLADALQIARPEVAAEVNAVGAKLVSAQRLLGPLSQWTGPDGRSVALLARAFRDLLPVKVLDRSEPIAPNTRAVTPVDQRPATTRRG